MQGFVSVVFIMGMWEGVLKVNVKCIFKKAVYSRRLYY